MWQLEGPPDYVLNTPREDDDLYMPEIYRCEQCGDRLDEDVSYCDECLVRIAKMCGDWDDESRDALKRLTKNATR